jgi:hypothetical protein
MSKKNLTTKPTVHQNQTFKTNFIYLDENTRNVLSGSSSSETAQTTIKKRKAAQETNTEDEVSNLTLDGFRITRVEFEKLSEYNKQSIINSIIKVKNTKVVYTYWKQGNEIKKFFAEKHDLKDAIDLNKYILNIKGYQAFSGNKNTKKNGNETWTRKLKKGK